MLLNTFFSVLAASAKNLSLYNIFSAFDIVLILCVEIPTMWRTIWHKGSINVSNNTFVINFLLDRCLYFKGMGML